MKKLFLPLCLLLAGRAGAQQRGTNAEVPAQRAGTVTYERVTQVRRPAGLPEEVAARLPKERTDLFELLFNNDQSLWRTVPTADGGDQTVTAGNGSFVVRQMANNDESYFNFSKGQRIDRRELFDNEFVVTDTIARLPWKLGEETKVVLGHTVRKATAQRIGQRMSMSMDNGQMKRTAVTDTSMIVAWYSTDIPVSVGPQDFQGQLPGLVLEVDVNNGRQIYRAVEIKNKVALKDIREPKGGKHVTPAEFQKESDRLMEEMRARMPQGANIRIQQ